MSMKKTLKAIERWNSIFPIHHGESAVPMEPEFTNIDNWEKPIKFSLWDDYMCFYEKTVPHQWPTLFWEAFVNWEKYVFSSRYSRISDIEKYTTNLFFYPPYAKEMKNIKTYVNIL